MTTKAKTRQDEAIEQLRDQIKPGDTLRTILRHVSSSGMTRAISVIKIDNDGSVWDISYVAARAIGGSIDQRWGGVKRTGAGQDMGFDLVYSISNALYGYGASHGYECLGDRCPSNSHVNDRNAPRGAGVEHRDGYAISQRWL